MPDHQQFIIDAIGRLLAARKADPLEVRLESDIYEDLLMDSLEIAELSAILEDSLGNDPYTDGIVPRTVGELVGYYQAA